MLVLLVMAAGEAVYFYMTRRRKARRAVAEYEGDLTRQIKYAEDDVLRYQKLYETLKNSEAKQTFALPQDGAKGAMHEELFMTAERILLEQQKLALEKDEIAQRNRKTVGHVALHPKRKGAYLCT